MIVKLMYQEKISLEDHVQRYSNKSSFLFFFLGCLIVTTQRDSYKIDQLQRHLP